MLDDSDSYKESVWQKLVTDLFLLIFPQYIAVLNDVSVKEYYTNPSRATMKYFDLVLVNANGCIDLIEIKRPIRRGMVSVRPYRDNHFPLQELSGAIMQAEKYIFYLNKAGVSAERDYTKRYTKQIPKGMEIRISNPKSIILCGRDNGFTTKQREDFEFIRKKYSNVIDIITYDDLLRRLDNLIEMLKIRS